MPLEGADFFACFYIPEFDGVVITTAYQSLAVGTKINSIVMYQSATQLFIFRSGFNTAIILGWYDKSTLNFIGAPSD